MTTPVPQQPGTFAEAIGTEDEPAGNPVLAAAAEAIIRRRLAAAHHLSDERTVRLALAPDALADASAAIAGLVARWQALKDWLGEQRKINGYLIEAGACEEVLAKMAELEGQPDGAAEWLVKVLPGGAANSYRDESDAHEAARMVSRTGHASELWHRENGGWKFREHYRARGSSDG